MLDITVHMTKGPIIGRQRPAVQEGPALRLRVLRTMVLKMLRMKVMKSFKANNALPKTTRDIGLVLEMADKTVMSLEAAKDPQEIDWLGIDDASILYAYTT
jgi:hypothetical protein